MKRLYLAVALLIAVSSTLDAATIVIVNKDPGGVGFNDPTPAAPVGGNAGTTLGQQRINVFQAAAGIWGAKLNSSITIKIAANFGALTPCGVSSGVLGSAGPTNFNANFTNAPQANTWYPVALASALSGTDMAAGLTDGASIQAQFNSNIGTSGCLPSLSWYLGLDGNHGSQIDLETVLLHEFGHGLGFIGLVSLSDGSMPLNMPDIFARFTFDSTSALHWNVMTNAERLTSITNTGNVVFDGSNVVAGATTILSAGKDGSNRPRLFVPNPIQEGSSVYHYDTSAFPNQLMEPAINSDLTHNVDAPNDLTAKAMNDIGWPPAVAISAPTGVVATPASGTSVGVTWNSAAGAVSYDVYRSSSGTSYAKIGSSGTTNYTDNVASANTAYLYAVKAIDGSSNASAFSNPDLATTFVYTNTTLTAGSSLINAVDLTELRTAVNAVRTLDGIGAGFYTNGTITAGSSVVQALDINELRTNLNTALTGLGFSSPSYTNPVLTAGSSLIKAVDFTELRNAMR